MTLENFIGGVRLLKELWPLLAVVLLFIARRWGKDARYQRTVGAAIDLAGILVADAERTVRDLKNPTTPGHWDEATRAQVKAAVVDRLRTALGPGVRVLEANLREGRDLSLDEFLGRLVEAQVERQRAATKPVPPTPAVPLTPGDPRPS